MERLSLEAPDNPDIFEKKPSKRPKLNDPVVDPRESWGEMFWRVSEFRPPPLVERSSLPPELQTKNTVYDKLSKMINNKSKPTATGENKQDDMPKETTGRGL